MTQDLRKRSADKAVSRYSSLFTLPSFRSIKILLCISCIIGGISAVFPFHLSFHSLLFGLSLGVFLFLATLFGNCLSLYLFLKKDPILNLRRFSFLSLSSNLFLLVFVFIANLALASYRDPNLWINLTSLGLFASISLRFLVLYSVSFIGLWEVIFSVLFQPALFLILTSIIPFSSFGFQNCIPFFAATFAAFFGVYIFIASLNTLGKETVGIPSIKLFRAFLADWTENLEKPFEEILEQLGEEHDVKVSLIAFKTGKRFKAVIVVPNFHPGPFKNIGSSSIPSLIQEALEKNLGCVVSVPHGISGHELDLASHVQNKKVLDKILEAAEFNVFHTYASQFMSLKKDDANVGCQIFGDCALLTLTFAPKTMEDLPLELNDTIIHEVKRRGFAWAVAIDAHNSVEGRLNLENVITPMKKGVEDILEEAVGCERLRFEVGAAKVVPKEFGIKEGMGPGGISVIVVKVGDQKTAYVTIDGNNMVPNLREKILSSLQELGISNGEVLTTDTHVVNGVVIAERGYFPVGEMIDHDRLIEYIKMAAGEALKNLEPAKASWRQEDICGVRVIGERQIDNLCEIVDKAAIKAKRNSVIIFPAFGILLIAALFILL